MITSILNLWELQGDFKVGGGSSNFLSFKDRDLKFGDNVHVWILNQRFFIRQVSSPPPQHKIGLTICLSFPGAATLHLTGLEDVKVVASEQSDIEADDISVR